MILHSLVSESRARRRLAVLLSITSLAAVACSSGNDESEDDADSGAPPPSGHDGGDAPDAAAQDDAGAGSGDPGAATWPMMGYDERNWYFNPGEHELSVDNAATLAEKWRFTVGGYPPGTPIVGDGKVFVMATGGTYAIDLESGMQVWARTDIAGSASVAWEPGFVYVHANGANLYKLDAETGMTVWGPIKSYDLAGCDGTSSPILGGGLVVVGHSCGPLEVGFSAPASPALGGVEARSTADGEMGWSYATVNGDGEDGAMVWSSVGINVAAGIVYASTGNNYSVAGPDCDAIHAIDLASGERKWVRQVRASDTWSFFGNIGGPDTDFGANPIVAEVGGKQLVAAGDKGAAFWAIDRATDTGEIAWSREGLSAARDQAHGGFLMNGAFDGTTFYGVTNETSSGAAILYAMNGETGADVFPPIRFEGKYTWGAPSLANGVLVVPNDDDLHVLDASDGTSLAVFNTGGTIAAGAAAIVAGKVIVGSGLQYPLGTVLNNNQVICYGLP